MERTKFAGNGSSMAILPECAEDNGPARFRGPAYPLKLSWRNSYFIGKLIYHTDHFVTLWVQIPMSRPELAIPILPTIPHHVQTSLRHKQPVNGRVENSSLVLDRAPSLLSFLDWNPTVFQVLVVTTQQESISWPRNRRSLKTSFMRH